MTLQPSQRIKIITALLEQRKNYDGTDAAFCKIYKINNAVFSRLKKGESQQMVADAKLVPIGRMLNVNFSDADSWVIVETETYKYITDQLRYCQQNNEARMLVDMPEIGKTTAGVEYALRNKNVFYVDCSQVKTKREFIKELARTVGVDNDAKQNEVIKDTIYTLQLLDNPLVILDEAGDLEYPAWLELKAYWNALEGACGWYMMGADGLKAKVQRHIRSRKVGYTEIFSRYGSDYKQATPRKPLESKSKASKGAPTYQAELAIYLRNEAKLVAMANLKDKANLNEVLDISEGLRRVKSLVKKFNKTDKK